MSDILTIKEIADYLRMEEHAIYRLARQGKLPAFKLSNQWRFKKDLLDEWINEKVLENSENPIARTSE
ncbi:MAG: helix-turn-helix domain-containing protein [Thermodesulfobacteriota bacterium]